ncbi:monovalent cation/H+ antiporter subunit A [Persicimonas caeni]|uniref:Monovalent cation/H+ antiporter subunit A n=1 Tax=Persicimonas caeni TaxID=2292766 RepID=A0A4Y6PXS2_PERCE|nr:monovalent cation/H+ antiporter subunit A [Persicimonas caeni]QDG53040.1 monovalent cation/H+ antiporter subunit A [Persicimonas caeni]QED34262.1 monovalent cation/H+ antiporter subunit A [Persicimonas caeni]
MNLLLIICLPLAGLLLPLLADRFGRVACAVAAAIPTVISLVLLLGLAPQVLAGEVLTVGWPWVESLGLNLSFRLDGLGFLFALLILGIGLCVITYAYTYLYKSDPIGRFYAMLMAFMGAMLGVVLSENLVLMALFWEMTSLSSFLLIGYWTHKSEAQAGARMALTITGAGGLCLFGGVIMIGHIVGSFELSDVLASADVIQNHDLYIPALCLVLAGAFTKSAQFPFHFWLPNAMTAPTPVSAYLHSATMVKAGVFLLARLHPALAGTDPWFFIVTFTGLATLTVGAYVAFFKDDLKGLLAYSTISHLGLITVLFGFGSPFAAVIGVFHIMNHAAFKASLFMTAGIVDHEAGTRDISKLGGLRRLMPYTMVLGLLGAAAMAGVPLFNGFLSKEMFFDATWKLPQMEAYPWLVPVLATFGGLFSVAYSIRFVHGVFFGEEVETPKKAHDPSWLMMAPVALLVTISVVVGIVPKLIVEPLLGVAASAVIFGGQAGELPYYSLALWHGFNAPLIMSLIAFAGASLVYWRRKDLYTFAERTWPGLTGRTVFEHLLEGLTRASRALSGAIENGSLQRYIAWLLAFAILAMFWPFWEHGWHGTGVLHTPVDPVSAVMIAIMLTGALGTVLLHRNRFLAVILLSTVGLVAALIFVRLSAPDLAMTQLSVEVVTILLLLLALFMLPRGTPKESSPPRQLRDIGLAVLGGGGAAALTWGIITRPFETISGWHIEQSYPGGGGTNVVNVILVDFRGFDTMLEVSVLAIAALGVFMLLDGLDIEETRDIKDRASDPYPVMLVSFSRPLLSMIILMSIFIMLRGHNLPGGGFIGGLVATVALVMQEFASGVNWTEERARVNFRRMAVWGVALAVVTGGAALLFELPFLTTWHGYVYPPLIGKLHLASALIFDLGVYFAVIGSMMVILGRLGRLGGAADPKKLKGREEDSPWKP